MASPLQIVLGTAVSVAIIAAVQSAAKGSIERSKRPYGQLLDMLPIPFVAYLFVFTDLGLSAAAILVGSAVVGIIIGGHRAKLGEWHPDGLRWRIENEEKPEGGGAVNAMPKKTPRDIPEMSDHELAEKMREMFNLAGNPETPKSERERYMDSLRDLFKRVGN